MEQKKLGMKATRRRSNIAVHIILAILAAVWVFPVLWVVMTSFRGERGSYVSTFFPQTLIISIFSCILSAFFVLSAAYCLSRLRFNMRRPFMNMAMILGLFPGFMSMIAVYFILKAVGLTEGNLIRLALILCYSGGAALGFQIIKGFFDTMPKELD